jgi:hypothetical protein
MGTTTYPTLAIPEITADDEAILMHPDNIRLGEDIRNPDYIIDNIIYHLKNKGDKASWVFAVREFTHPEKVHWILSLPGPDSKVLPEEHHTFPITVHVTVMQKVAETSSGEPLFAKKVIEKKLEKCMPINAEKMGRSL